MRKRLLLAALYVAGALGFQANAQTDVTSKYIPNSGFEDCEAYAENIAAAEATDRNLDYSEYGWTASAGVAWCSSAVVAYGGTGQVNGVNAPSADNAGNGGNALGISVGWGGEVTYTTAKVTLPAGYYVLTANANNQLAGVTQLYSRLGFVATNGKSFMSTRGAYPYNEWVEDNVAFYLDEDTEGCIQVGGQAVSGGSGANAKVFFDNLTLVYYKDYVDFTSKVNTDGWQSEIGNVGNYTKDVAQKEQYNGSTVETLGEVLYQTVEGLENGTYTVELYANASYTEGRGFATDAANGDLGRVVVYAGDVEKTIPVIYQVAVGENNIVTLENVVVSDGTLKMGLRKNIAGSNWHTIQIKSLVKNSSEANADEEAQNAYWNDIANYVMSANANVGGYEKAELAAAVTKGDIQDALIPFYAGRAAYNDLANAISEAEAVGMDVSEYKNLIADENTTADDAEQAKHVVKLAINTKAVAGASPENPIVTGFVVNGTFDTTTSPWATTTGAQNRGLASNQQGAFTGNFFENWNPSNYTGKMYQTIEDIPNGRYTLKIAAFVNNFAGDESQYVYANDVKTPLVAGEPTTYTIDFEVTDHTVEIGFEQTEANNNWSGIDNVSIVCNGVKNAIVIDPYENGTVTVDTEEAYEGDVVSITAEAAADYELVEVTVTSASGEAVEVETDWTGAMSFTMPAEDVTVSATFQEAYFKLSNYVVATDGIIEEDGTVKAVVTFDEDVKGSYAEDETEVVFTYEVADAEGKVVVSGEINQNPEGETNIYVSDLKPEAEYTITITGVNVLDYTKFDYSDPNLDWDDPDLVWAKIVFSAEGELATTTFTAKKKVYAIEVAETENGKVSVNPTEAAEGDVVNLTIEPAEGYELVEVTVTGASGETYDVTIDPWDGNFFTMPAEAVTVKATFQEAYVKLSNYELACDGEFDEDGDVTVVVTYDYDIKGSYLESWSTDVQFFYEVTDAEGNVVASGQKNPQNITDGTLNIFVSNLESNTEYTITITSVDVTDFMVGEGSIFFEEGTLATLTFTTPVPTGIANVEAAPAVKADGKYLENGQIVIYRGGIKYNAAGAVIR